MVDHVLQPGALVRLADQDAIADPAEHLQVASVIAADLDAANILNVSQPVDERQREADAGEPGVEQPKADVDVPAAGGWRPPPPPGPAPGPPPPPRSGCSPLQGLRQPVGHRGPGLEPDVVEDV